MGTGDLFRVPPAAVHHGRAWQSSRMGPCGYCRWVLMVPGPAGQYSGKIGFIELCLLLSCLPRGGSKVGGNSFYLAPGCRLAQETCRLEAQAVDGHRRQGRDHVGIVDEC